MPIFKKYFISYETDLARLLKQENAFNVLLRQGNLKKEDLIHFMRQKYGYYLWFLYASQTIQSTQPLRQVSLVMLAPWPWSQKMSQFFSFENAEDVYTQPMLEKQMKIVLLSRIFFVNVHWRELHVKFSFPNNIRKIVEENIFFSLTTHQFSVARQIAIRSSRMALVYPDVFSYYKTIS